MPKKLSSVGEGLSKPTKSRKNFHGKTLGQNSAKNPTAKVKLPIKKPSLKKTNKNSEKNNTQQINKVSCQVEVCKLYIRFKKSIQALGKTETDLWNLHPDITYIKLPRRGIKEKFFFAIFPSKQKALSAIKEIKAKEDCFVNISTKHQEEGQCKKVSNSKFEK